MSRTREALCAGLKGVRVALVIMAVLLAVAALGVVGLVIVAMLVAAWFVQLWSVLRRDPAKWQLDIERLVEEAQRAGLCSPHVDLELLIECEPVSPTRLAVAFVRESRDLSGTSVGPPELVGGERVFTMLSAVPRAVYDAVLARPADERLEALLEYEARGQDVPPDDACIYARLRETLQRRRDVFIREIGIADTMPRAGEGGEGQEKKSDREKDQ